MSVTMLSQSPSELAIYRKHVQTILAWPSAAALRLAPALGRDSSRLREQTDTHALNELLSGTRQPEF